MPEESMQFKEGGSDKFWKIKLVGNSFTVHYGRIGTSGQTQTKSFSSEAEAQKAYDKLVAEKLKKGYSRTGDSVGAMPADKSAPCAAAQAEERSPDASEIATISGVKASALLTDSGNEMNTQSSSHLACASVATMEPEPVAQAPVSSPAPLVKVERKVSIKPEDMVWAVWRPRVMKQKAPSKKPIGVQELMSEVTADSAGRPKNWAFYDARQKRHSDIETMSYAEANFWITAHVNYNYFIDPSLLEQFHEFLRNQNYEEALSSDDLLARFNNDKKFQGRHCDLFELLAPLVCIAFTPVEIIQICLGIPPQHVFFIMQAFRKQVLPYLQESELTELQNRCQSHLFPELTVKGPAESTNWSAYTVAAFLRMSDQVLDLVQQMPDNLVGCNVFDPQLYVLSLGSAQEIVQQANRLFNLPINVLDKDIERRHLGIQREVWRKAWIACTEFAGLAELLKLGRLVGSRDTASEFFSDLKQLEGPELVPCVISLLSNQYVQPLARRWLQEHPDWSAPQLYEATLHKGEIGKTADEILASIRNRIDSSAVPPEILEVIRTKYALPDEDIPEIDDTHSPDWLKTGLSQVKPGKAGLPEWLPDLSLLPRIIVNKHRLTLAQMKSVVDALQQSTFEKTHPLISSIRSNQEHKYSDKFAWSLFDAWLKDGADSKHKWAMQATGFLGSDETVLKLIPLIRIWPGESQHPRAVLGLECLRQIGTDTALMQINGLAQKLQFKALKQKAAECIEQIAQQRGMSRADLEDRIVPDCGLDEKGQRIFDFGPRQFRFALGSDLKAMIRESDGKLRSDLPKPTSKDDPEKSREAADEWKVLKQQIKDVAKIQAFRMEQSMITGRKWKLANFQTLLVRHPLMTHIVSMLIWGVFDEFGKLTQSFRVTEDQKFADCEDGDITLDADSEIGLIHPLQISDVHRQKWGEILTDYEIIPPFPQLERPIYKLEPAELEANEITRFANIKVPAVSLVGTLERQGWQRGSVEDGGCFHCHAKQFPGAGVSAVVSYDGVPVGMMVDWNDQSIDACFFVKWPENTTSIDSWHIERLKHHPLKEVDPIVISEVLSDLILISSKSKTE